MELLNQFAHGIPSVYDLANFTVSILLLFVCSGLHARQIKSKKEIAELKARLDGETT